MTTFSSGSAKNLNVVNRPKWAKNCMSHLHLYVKDNLELKEIIIVNLNWLIKFWISWSATQRGLFSYAVWKFIGLPEAFSEILPALNNEPPQVWIKYRHVVWKLYSNRYPANSNIKNLERPANYYKIWCLLYVI